MRLVNPTLLRRLKLLALGLAVLFGGLTAASYWAGAGMESGKLWVKAKNEYIPTLSATEKHKVSGASFREYLVKQNTPPSLIATRFLQGFDRRAFDLHAKQVSGGVLVTGETGGVFAQRFTHLYKD